MDRRGEDAYRSLKIALEANIFYHDQDRKWQIQLHMLASACQLKDYQRINDIGRALTFYHPLDEDILRLFNVCLVGGPDAAAAFGLQSNGKFFTRQCRLIEQNIEEFKRRTGNRKVPDEYRKPLYLMNAGHSMQLARSYGGSLSYYIRAYQHDPKDPLVNLCCGVACLHRAMQRTTENRHEQIMQALTFLFQYYELSGQSLEANYNIARALHQIGNKIDQHNAIGLLHLAIPYYERVLAWAESESHLKRETAYNLAIFYSSIGSPALAKGLMTKYLVF
jgi:general transcription factor 3C polypeptide 3 (transcription factor C subunit 4)